MSCKVKCVGANLHLSPKKEDEVTRFNFICFAPPVGLDGEIWPESQMQVWTKDHSRYTVGKSYEMYVEIKG